MFQFDAENPLIDEGVWREFKGSKFLIAHISNDKFQKALAKYQQPHVKKMEERKLEPSIHKDILCKAMGEALILDWQDVVDRNKKPTPYSPKAAHQALLKSLEFRDFVTDVASALSNFVEEELEEVGNGFGDGPTGLESGARA